VGEGSNCGSQLIWLNRLGQVGVEAGLHRFVALLLSGVGGESDSRNLSPTLCQKLLDFGVMVGRDLAEGPPLWATAFSLGVLTCNFSPFPCAIGTQACVSPNPDRSPARS
jgi:hypothetical protein